MYRVEYSENTYTIRDRDSGDEWDQGEYGCSVALLNLYRSPFEGYCVEIDDYDCIYGMDDIPVGGNAYVLFVKYRTGSTFGSQEAWCIAAVKSMEALAHIALAKTDEPHDGEQRYRPWDGYFERLLEAEVMHFVVK